MKSSTRAPAESMTVDRAQASKLKTMPNSGYLFYGYNVALGNPHSTDGSLDPGFTKPIFTASYSQNRVTGDLRFRIPDGTTFQNNVGCSIDMSSSEVKGEASYKKALSVDAQVQGSGMGFSFSASADYQSVKEGTSTNHDVFVETEAVCKVFQGSIQYYQPPFFDDEIITALKSLNGTTYAASKSDFLQFINYFGTHFVDTVVMGAKYGYLFKLTEQAYSTLESEDIKMSVAASYSGLLVSGGGSVSVGSAGSDTQAFANSISSTKIFSTGSAPPSDDSATTWANNAISEPMPISYVLRQISDVFTNKFFNLTQLDKLNIDTKTLSAEMQNALNSYCPDYLIPNNKTTDCTAPTTDPSGGTIAPAADLESGSWVVLRNVASGKCLTEIKTSNLIVSRTCQYDAIDQQWKFVYSDSRGFKAQDYSGEVWDIPGCNTPNGINLGVFDDLNNDCQRYAVSREGAYYKFTAYISKRCIDVNGGNTADFTQVYQWDCASGKQEQQFASVAAQANPITNGSWVTLTNAASGMCLTDNGFWVNTVQHACDPTNANQLWKFNPAGNGYQVIVKGSQRVWDVDNMGTDNGIKWQTFTVNNNANQRFFVQREGNYYRFIARNSNKCLDLSGGNMADAAPYAQYDCQQGNKNQLFTMTPVTTS